jgi:hypothetical protein
MTDCAVRDFDGRDCMGFREPCMRVNVVGSLPFLCSVFLRFGPHTHAHTQTNTHTRKPTHTHPRTHTHTHIHIHTHTPGTPLDSFCLQHQQQLPPRRTNRQHSYSIIPRLSVCLSQSIRLLDTPPPARLRQPQPSPSPTNHYHLRQLHDKTLPVSML